MAVFVWCFCWNTGRHIILQLPWGLPEREAMFFPLTVCFTLLFCSSRCTLSSGNQGLQSPLPPPLLSFSLPTSLATPGPFLWVHNIPRRKVFFLPLRVTSSIVSGLNTGTPLSIDTLDEALCIPEQKPHNTVRQTFISPTVGGIAELQQQVHCIQIK